MTVTRGKFLQALGKSLPGMLLGSGLVGAAQQVLSKMAAASGNVSLATGKEPASKQIANSPALPELIHHGPETGPQVALTFDDGPRPGVTDRILDELQHRGLHATFFMIGREVNAAPDLARRVLAEGHTIANHSLTHPRLSDLPNAQATHEIQRAQDIFADVLGVRPIWFRPPYGALRPDQHEMVRGLGLRTVMWNVDPGDWAQPGEDKIISTILRETQAGAIILCHDRHPQTANAIGVILDGLLERGFRPVTLSVLME